MAEQTRAARDILKAAQNTKEQASQVRRATREQVRTTNEIAKAAESMRRGAATTAPGACRAGDRRRADYSRRGGAPAAGRDRHQGDDRTGGRDEEIWPAARTACARSRSRHRRALADQTKAMREMTAAAAEHGQADQADHQGQRRAVFGRCGAAGVGDGDPADHRSQRQRRQADTRRHRRPAARARRPWSRSSNGPRRDAARTADRLDRGR